MSAASEPRWRSVAEKGGTLGIWLVIVIATSIGRRAARALLWWIAWWYVLLHAGVRRASRAYLSRLGGRARLAEVHRHVLTFAEVTLDRLYMVRGDFRPFRIETEGEEHLRALAQARRGAVLLLAHLGSFEVLRGMSTARDLPVNMLGYFGNARRINAALRRLNPAVDTRLVEIRPEDPTFALEVLDRVEAGEMVGVMGDRVGPDGKSVSVRFLGSAAPFPTGPYLLAASLRCPVYLAFGLYHAPDRYRLVCEPFAERLDLPRDGRAAALAALAARYAERLEHHLHDVPFDWFNFYDFWNGRPEEP